METTIKFRDFTITPILESAKRAKISDEEYFSSKYAGFISNSKLAYINPEQGGSPEKYYNGLKSTFTTSLMLGSAIHELVLQPEFFTLGDKCKKPSAKLGAVLDKIKKYRREGFSIHESIIKASNDCQYYVKNIENKIPKIIAEGLSYYLTTKDFDDSVITLNDKDWDSCFNCVTNVGKNKKIQNKLHPLDNLGEELPTYNEDAIFLDLKVSYKKEKSVILRLKMKADNWTIDEENKILTLNDLKTTSKPVAWFMNKEYGSFYHYCYYRQFALYMLMLKTYCQKQYHLDDTWECLGNVLVVNTLDYNTACLKVNKSQMKKGIKEYEELLKRVAYYEIFGYDKEVTFK